MLDAAAQEHWAQHGWLWLRGFLGAAEVEDLRRWTDEVAAPRRRPRAVDQEPAADQEVEALGHLALVARRAGGRVNPARSVTRTAVSGYAPTRTGSPG